jgi:AraC-like DNA-binding protein
MYCAKGEFIFDYFPSDGDPEHITIYKGQFILINPGSFHHITIEDNNARIMNLEFEPKIGAAEQTAALCEISKMNGVLANICEDNGPFYIFTDHDLYVENDIRQIIDEMSFNGFESNSKLLMQTLLIKLFIDVSRCAQNVGLSRNCMLHLKKAVKYIQNNFHRISAADAARACGISTAYMQRIFKKELNETFISFVTKIRVHNAKKLLLNTNTGIDEIAAACGYTNRRHLLTVFRKCENCTPSAFRKNNKDRQIADENFFEQIFLSPPPPV